MYFTFLQLLIKVVSALLLTAASCQPTATTNPWHYSTIDHPHISTSRAWSAAERPVY